MNIRRKWILLLVAVGVLTGAWQATAQTSKKKTFRRAKLPEFSGQEASRVFFDDVFSKLDGNRPASSRPGQDPGRPTATVPSIHPDAGPDSGFLWSQIVTATTLEDEIKALKLEVDMLITTPSAFAGRGHKPTRQLFSLLAALFAIIDLYDGDVRWKGDAAVARDKFARTAANLQAGGAIQVYNEAKQRKQDLDDLVRGSRLQASGVEEINWAAVVDRAPLMQLLETRFESNLKQWTSSKAEFTGKAEKVRHEAELVVAIAEILMQEGMQDASDDEYRVAAQLLKGGGTAVVQAVKVQDNKMAEKGVSDISRSCVVCHENYR